MALSLLDAAVDTGSTGFGNGGGSFAVAAGVDRNLVYITCFEGPGSIVDTVEYGGQAMTEVLDAVNPAGNDMRIQVWLLNDAGIAAAVDTDFVLTGSSFSGFRGLAFSVQGALQTVTPVDTDSNNASPSGVALNIDVEAGGFVFALMATANTVDISWAGVTDRVELDDIMTRALAFDTTPTTETQNLTPTVTGAGGGGQVSVAVSLEQSVTSGEVSGVAAMSFGGSVTLDDLPETTLGLASGLRRVFVSKGGNDSNDGLSAGTAKLTIQGAFNIALPGDVISINGGIYYETPTLNNFPGTTTNGLWVVAQRRGDVVVSNLWREAFEGTQVWDDEGGGVFSAVHGDLWSGSHGDDFLFRYTSEADLRAAVLTVTGGLQGTNNITKPLHGFATEGGRIYVRLRGDVNPNGQQIKLTDDFSQNLVDLNNADNVVIDGLRLEGSGDTPSVTFDTNCANPVIRNCVTDHCRGLARMPSNALAEWNEFTKTGFADWMREVRALDGQGNIGVFDINKSYNTLSGNTFYEGGMIFGSGSVDENIVVRFNWIHGVFEGLRGGEHDNALTHDNIIEEIGDNAIQFESFRSSDLSANHLFFHNLVRNIHDGALSHQSGNDFVGPHHVFRNVIIDEDVTISTPIFIIKMINSLTNHANPGTVEINYYHNLFLGRRGLNAQASPDDLSTIWSDNFSNSDADAITLFANNVAIFQDGLDTTPGTGVPQNILTNILAAPSDNTVFQGGGGSRVANEAALLLGANRQLLPGSPLIGAGTDLTGDFSDADFLPDDFDPALFGELPDVVTGSNRNDDLGPFPNGFDPGADWPRPAVTTFENTIPALFSTDLATSDASVSGSSAALNVVSTVALAVVDASASGSNADLAFLRQVDGVAALSTDTSAIALSLRLVTATASIVTTTSAESNGSTGAAGLAALSFANTATADIPPEAIPELDLAATFLSFKRPVFLVDLSFDSGDINIWTRPVPGQFRGKEYVPLAGITGGLTVRNSLDQGSLDISVQLSGQSPELLNIALTQSFQRRPATVCLGNMDENNNIIADEILILGTIANMPVTDDGDESIVSLQIDSIFKDVQRTRTLRLSTSDQALINADDSFFAFAATDDVETERFGG